MKRLVDKEEVREALFAMKPIKALGLDGFPALFFQSQWQQVVGQKLFEYVQNVFNGTEIGSNMCSSLIVLIPKGEAPEYSSQCRPISLLPVIFKVLVKVVANRLKPFMNLLIEETQASFILETHIVDNIIVVQEVVHSFHEKQGRRGWMMVKIDLEKAYDRLRWEFIYDSLVEAQIPENIIDILIRSWNAHSSHILWNGTCFEKFFPSRGVRLGDPLAPYLFVLCIEKLAHGIKQAVEQEMWKPIRLGKHGPPLTYLFFMDDLILLAEASESQMEVIKGVLEDFCACLRGKVCIAKSTFFCSKNVPMELNIKVKDCSGFSYSDSMGKYIGVPLLHGRKTAHIYKSLIDKVRSRLCAWKASSLSSTGRLTLVQSVLTSIPLYTMQTISIPLEICKKIELLCRNFLWHGDGQSKKVHLLRWSTLCKPKAQGGNQPSFTERLSSCSGPLEESAASRSYTPILSSYIPKMALRREISIKGQLNTIKSMAVTTWNNWLTCPLQNGRPGRQEEILIGWAPPPVDWIALNSDGAYKSGKGVASVGGVLRHSNGSWIIGYGCKSGTSTAYRAELWGVFQGLKLAWDHGYRRIQVQVDNKIVVNALNTQATHPCSNTDVIRAIKALLSRQ
ncbi:LINE-type retrotransposon LIb DNA, Insertion at the S11 site-like protein [Theobroma cacao]|uniref:LINE-type retrotransposon LIb DNA, Insertion at the S11 site-like protein n=1 Tax=Theobroma cacao TaxID=3641 RepID=A0A061EBR6_THECC|nr:LINE-type retrotransposon LIb DNA, Insertion at the S11 site-like protein [Theobroma cacao]